MLVKDMIRELQDNHDPESTIVATTAAAFKEANEKAELDELELSGLPISAIESSEDDTVFIIV